MRAAKFLVGSMTVYAIVAACSGTASRYQNEARPDGAVAADSSGNGGANGAGGVPSGDAATDARSDALFDAVADVADALTDPVPEADADTSVSGTRLKARYYVGLDGSKQFAGWYDSQRKEDCTVTLMSDGKQRCAPDGVTITPVFADSGCTKPLALITVGGCAEKYATWVNLECSPGTHIASIGAVHTGSYYTGTPGDCASHTNPCFQQGAICELREIAPIELSEFQEMTVEVD